MALNSKLPPFLDQALNKTGSPLAAITEGISALAQRSSDAFKTAQAANPSSAFADVRKNLRAAAGAQASKLDLVTQEEFQIQRALLEKSIIKLAELSKKIADLEAQIAASSHLKTPEIPASSGLYATPPDAQK
jgi:ubiquinone biosynthesis accessory factor UbiK